MEIEKYISELLFEHDCVILPGFGGFVCNISSAIIKEGKNQFHPPFKKISFNRNLKNNDGLLANHVAQAENISYAGSNHFISEYIDKLTAELYGTKRFELKNIGLFYLGNENNILFEQDETMNYLPGSFGLKIFHAPVIKRETIERKIERKLKDKIIVPSKEQKEIPVKRKVPVARYVAAAASVLLIVSLVIVSLQTNFLKNIHIAGMNPFAAGEKPLYQANEEALPEMDIIKDDVSSLLASNRNDTTRYLHIVINGNVPIVVSLQDETVVKKETKIKMHASGRYHIIGGAFSVARNAEKFKKKLEKLGYDAFIIEKKLQFVSYGSYATREEALQALEKIKAVQNDVWLMTN